MSTRNYEPLVKEFVDFLVSYVLVFDENKRQNPRKLQTKTKNFPHLKKIFLNEEDQEESD